MGESCRAPLPRPSPQRRGPPRPPQSCRCQRSSWGASRAGRRLPVPRARPHPRPPRLLPARARPTQLAPGPARLSSRGCRLTAPASPGAPRSLPPSPTLDAWRPGGQRRFLAPALGGGRWRFESGPPGLTFRAVSSCAPARSPRRTTPSRTPLPPIEPPQPSPAAVPPDSEETREIPSGGHLRHNRHRGSLAPFAPSVWRSRLLEGVREGRSPL